MPRLQPLGYPTGAYTSVWGTTVSSVLALSALILITGSKNCTWSAHSRPVPQSTVNYHAGWRTLRLSSSDMDQASRDKGVGNICLERMVSGATSVDPH